MFWGLIMEPNKRYTQTVERSFHVSMAALDCSSAENEQIQVMLSVGKKNYLLCTLHPKNTIQAVLDLNFQSGDEIAFMSNGKGHVHLTGYLIPEDDISNLMEMEDEAEESDIETVQMTKKSQKRKGNDNLTENTKKKSKLTKLLLNSSLEEDENDSSFDVNNAIASDEDDEDEDDDDGDDDEGDENDESDDEESEEDEDSEDSDKAVPLPQKKNSNEKSPKLLKQKVNQNGAKDKSLKNEHQVKTNKTPKNNKEQQKKNDKSFQGDTPSKVGKSPKEEKTPKSQKKAAQENAPTPQKKTVEGGVLIEDLKVGNGPIAKPGKILQVYYEGRLKSNNKVFDSTTQGAGFAFRLGKHEVIRGWDVGVAGMRTGGKRKIVCPPNMAYGAKGSPPVIPPNSTLVFEVELKSVN